MPRPRQIQPMRDEIHPNRILEEKHREVLDGRARNAVFFRLPITRANTPVSTPRQDVSNHDQKNEVNVNVDSSCCKCSIM